MTSSWMLVAGALFATMGVMVKIASAHFDAAELSFYRSAVSLAAVLGFVAWKRETVRSAHMRTHLVRGVLGVASLVAYFYAMTQISLATAITLNYTSPLFLAALTTMWLREKFSPWLVFAIALGFLGVGMLLQPTFAEGKLHAALIGLASGVLAALAYLNVRTLGRLGEPAWRTVFWFSFLGTVLCGAWVVAFPGFKAISETDALLLAGIGVLAAVAQLAMTRAYQTGNTLVVGAYAYSTIVFAAVASLAIFAEPISPLAWAGMAVIVASGLIAMRFEKKEVVQETGFEGD
jgi:drug/metabolite transporter (DMT)-like permease